MDAVAQAIEFGSVGLLLSVKPELASEVLNVIKAWGPSESGLIAWNEVCNIRRFYLNGRHFLTLNLNREYKVTYRLNRNADLQALNIENDTSSGIVDIPQDEPVDYPAFIYTNRFDIFSRRVVTVTQGMYILNTFRVTPSMVVRARATEFFGLIGDPSRVTIECVKKDILDPNITMTAPLCDIFCTRLNMLLSHAWEYFDIVKPRLLQFFIDSIRDVAWMKSEQNKSTLRTIFSLLGSDIDVDSPLFFFRWLSFAVKAYMFGFPIQERAPSLEEIADRMTRNQVDLQTLIRESSERYIVEWIHRHTGGGKELLFTEEDTLMESIYNYFPFDIFPYYDGKKVYVFTRNLFDNLTERGLNFYNNQKIDDITLELMRSRERMAQSLGLPKAECLTDAFSSTRPPRSESTGLASFLEGMEAEELSLSPFAHILMLGAIRALGGPQMDHLFHP